MVRWNPNQHNSPTELRKKQGFGFADLKGFTEPYPGEENFVHGVITVSLHWGALVSLNTKVYVHRMRLHKVCELQLWGTHQVIVSKLKSRGYLEAGQQK